MCVPVLNFVFKTRICNGAYQLLEIKWEKKELKCKYVRQQNRRKYQGVKSIAICCITY